MEMVKIVYNSCYGGFALSDAAVCRYYELKGLECDPDERLYDINRNDPVLAQVVEELGSKANAPSARLRIRELPKGTRYYLREYDGVETIITEDALPWEVA